LIQSAARVKAAHEFFSCRPKAYGFMQQVLIVIHLLIVIALVAVILLQRSEQGALSGLGGGGGGGGLGGLMTGRGQANLLTRTTAILAAAFFATSLLLAIISGNSSAPKSVIDQAAPATAGSAPAQPAGVLDQLKQLEGQPKPAQ
jgi:preprotein translocase subunit SecG